MEAFPFTVGAPAVPSTTSRGAAATEPAAGLPLTSCVCAVGAKIGSVSPAGSVIRTPSAAVAVEPSAVEATSTVKVVVVWPAAMVTAPAGGFPPKAEAER